MTCIEILKYEKMQLDKEVCLPLDLVHLPHTGTLYPVHCSCSLEMDMVATYKMLTFVTQLSPLLASTNTILNHKGCLKMLDLEGKNGTTGVQALREFNIGKKISALTIITSAWIQ